MHLLLHPSMSIEENSHIRKRVKAPSTIATPNMKTFKNIHANIYKNYTPLNANKDVIIQEAFNLDYVAQTLTRTLIRYEHEHGDT